jgi:hypothetical protein
MANESGWQGCRSANCINFKGQMERTHELGFNEQRYLDVKYNQLELNSILFWDL